MCTIGVWGSQLCHDSYIQHSHAQGVSLGPQRFWFLLPPKGTLTERCNTTKRQGGGSRGRPPPVRQSVDTVADRLHQMYERTDKPHVTRASKGTNLYRTVGRDPHHVVTIPQASCVGSIECCYRSIRRRCRIRLHEPIRGEPLATAEVSHVLEDMRALPEGMIDSKGMVDIAAPIVHVDARDLARSAEHLSRKLGRYLPIPFGRINIEGHVVRLIPDRVEPTPHCCGDVRSLMKSRSDLFADCGDRRVRTSTKLHLTRRELVRPAVICDPLEKLWRTRRWDGDLVSGSCPPELDHATRRARRTKKELLLYPKVARELRAELNL